MATRSSKRPSPRCAPAGAAEQQCLAGGPEGRGRQFGVHIAPDLGNPVGIAVERGRFLQRHPRHRRRLGLRRALTAHHAVGAVGTHIQDGAPTDPQDAGHPVDQDLQPIIAGIGHIVDQFELTVGVEHAGVGADGIDAHIAEGFGGGDEGVGQRVGGDLDDEIVDRVPRTTLHHVQGKDIGADRSQCYG